MPSDTIFRERVEPSNAEPIEHGLLPLEEGVSDLQKPTPVREEWESENCKYGLELFGIQETYREFPLKLHYGALKNYIDEQIDERGWEKNPKHFQQVLDEIEAEIGTKELETYARLKKLYEYIQISKKFQKIRAQKEAFRAFS